MQAPGDSSRHARRPLPLYLACYLLWFALSALAFWMVLQLRDNAIDLALLAFRGGGDRDAVGTAARVRTLDNVATIVLVLLWLGGVVLLEGYLREAVPLGRLWGRAARVFVAIAVVLGLSFALQAL